MQKGQLIDCLAEGCLWRCLCGETFDSWAFSVIEKWQQNRLPLRRITKPQALLNSDNIASSCLTLQKMRPGTTIRPHSSASRATSRHPSTSISESFGFFCCSSRISSSDSQARPFVLFDISSSKLEGWKTESDPTSPLSWTGTGGVGNAAGIGAAASVDMLVVVVLSLLFVGNGCKQ